MYAAYRLHIMFFKLAGLQLQILLPWFPKGWVYRACHTRLGQRTSVSNTSLYNITQSFTGLQSFNLALDKVRETHSSISKGAHASQAFMQWCCQSLFYLQNVQQSTTPTCTHP